ncbi:MAG: hypothetical protein HY774_02395 [Acidobacteria bacterium]|nr:hypothetical protein [Acidobacteriota bacterium]
MWHQVIALFLKDFDMGTFTCECGHVIRDTTYPTDGAGMLYWEADQEAIHVQATSAVRDFLAVRASYQRDWWLRSFFSTEYPVDLDDAAIIDDIYSKFAFEYGLSVYQCPKCQRIYVQKRSFENRWIGYKTEFDTK